MAITILSHSLSGNVAPIASVYNQINYIVDSTRKGRESFNYIADVYAGGNTTSQGTFICRLNSFPNLTNYYGQFDVHRPLESQLSSNPDLFSIEDIGYGLTNGIKNFRVKFGESFSTKNIWTSVAQGPLIFPGAYYLKLNFAQPHNLSVGDGVVIVKDDATVDQAYNQTTRVLSANSAYQVTLESVFGTGGTSQTGYVYEGAGFTSTTNTNGYLTLLCRNPHNFQTGDTVVISKFVTSINPEYDGSWTVNSVSSSTVFSVTAPYGTYTLNESGAVYKKGNIVLTGLTNSSNYTFIKNSVDDYDQIKSFGRARELSGFTLVNQTSQFLTNCPSVKIRQGEYHTMAFLYSGLFSAATADRFFYTFLDKSGNTYTNEYAMPGLFTGISSFDWMEFVLPTGLKNIDAMLYSEILTGDMPIVPNWDDYVAYTIFAYKTSTGIRSKVYQFEIDNSCTKYETYRFMWKNRLGAFDYFTFTKRSDTSLTIEKDIYERKLGSYNGLNYGYNIGDRGKIINNVRLTEKVSVFSDWVTEDEAAWLYELFASPEVYVLDGTNMIPIIITSNEYVIGKKVNQKMINYKVDFEYAFDKFSQRG